MWRRRRGPAGRRRYGDMAPLIRGRGYLPHWEGERAIYFVTFRLADSLPRELMERIRRERETFERAEKAGVSVAADRVRAAKLHDLLQEAQRRLDEGLGACYLREARIAKIVADAIQHFHQERYVIWAWCVMPNHVHVLVSLMEGHTLERVLHGWKSYSAHEANKVLGRAGHFWQREYFDHLVRNESSRMRITEYILQNPGKAGLRDWGWVGVLEGAEKKGGGMGSVTAEKRAGGTPAVRGV